MEDEASRTPVEETVKGLLLVGNHIVHALQVAMYGMRNETIQI